MQSLTSIKTYVYPDLSKYFFSNDSEFEENISKEGKLVCL